MHFKYVHTDSIKKLSYGLGLCLGMVFSVYAGQVQADTTALKQQLAQAETYRDAGNYLLAEKQLLAVLSQAEQQADVLLQAMATGALGYTYYLQRSDAKAEQFLQKSLLLATPLGYPGLSALLQNYLGLQQLALQQKATAKTYFNKALLDARLAQDPVLELSINLNLAKLGMGEARCMELQALSIQLFKLPGSIVKGNLLVNLAQQYQSDTDNFCTDPSQAHLKIQFQLLQTALELAEQFQQPRLQALAQGYLATLYGRQGRDQDALQWLEQALFTAQQAVAKDLLLRFETQRAQLLQKSGDINAALSAYRRAAQALSEIRRDLPAYLHDGQSSMRQLIDPTYRALADVLLIQARKSPSAETKQALLKEAIIAMEASKRAELEDFFNDQCLLDKQTSVDLLTKLTPGVAIIYPVILEDRLELLVRFGDTERIEMATLPVSKKQLAATALELNDRLRNGKDYRQASYKLYNWLLRAFQDEFKRRAIKTLIYVPDGGLRQVAIAALNDGKDFVAEHYAGVTLPGLTLEVAPMAHGRKPNALIAGLSKPDGPSLEQVSAEFNSGRKTLANAPNDQSQDAGQQRSNLVTQLSLPGISQEVAMLSNKMANTTLLNSSFTYPEFQQQLSSGAYSIVHVASHGFFGSHAGDSFIMAYDQTFKLSEFQALLNNAKPQQAPIDLLTLSACETAEGDDRALLGFSGIAIKTNALSAIGTLWPINDEAAVKFMTVLYSHLGEGETKAEALRQAQLSLLKEKKFSHPYYWSPFILVGFWQ